MDTLDIIGHIVAFDVKHTAVHSLRSFWTNEKQCTCMGMLWAAGVVQGDRIK